MIFHRLTEVDMQARTGICSVCGPVKIKSRGRDERLCVNKWREAKNAWYKTAKGAAYKSRGRTAYRAHVRPVCDLCGFKAPLLDVIDGHHKDRNRNNNSPSNIQSLCPICHRLVHLGREDLIKPWPIDFATDRSLERENLILKDKIRQMEEMYA